MKQKQASLSAFFTGCKPPPAKASPAKDAVGKGKAPAHPAARKDDPASDQENEVQGAKPAAKRLRRTIIEDDDDGAGTPGKAAAPASAAQPAGSTDVPMTEPPAAAAAAGGAGEAAAAADDAAAAPPAKDCKADPTDGAAAAAPAAAPAAAASKPAAPIASIFQRPSPKKPAAAAGAAAPAASPSAAAAAAPSPAAKSPAAASPAKAGGSGKAKTPRGLGGAKAAATTATTTRDAPDAAGPSTSAAKAAVTGRGAKAREEHEDGEEEEDEEGLEDAISDSDDDAGGAVKEGILGEDGAAAGGKAKKKGAGTGKKKKAAAAGKGAKMEGVGTGAVAAAAKYKEADVPQLITWKEGQPVPYSLLANTFESIAATTKRLEIVALLVSAFRATLATTPPDLLPAVYLCTNRVAPAHTGVELGIGEATLIKALCEATGKSEANIKKAYEEQGDLGVVAVGARSTQKTMFQPAPLTIASVLRAFKEIAQVTGAKSGDVKRGKIVKMLVAARGSEAGYVIRSLQAKLRIGLAEQSVLVALAHAVHLHREGAADGDGRLAERLEAAAQAVKQAYSECPSYDILIPALLDAGTADLRARCHFTPGVPIKPMLAKATNGVGEVLEKFGDCEFTVEYKYDGERAQVHVTDAGKSVHIFSRNAENNTPKYPDLVARLPGLLAPGVQSIVIDSEAVAYDVEKKKILPFQVLSTRARKDVAVGDIKVQVVLFAFDCLYLNGESLLHKPLTERRAALYGALVEREGQLQFASAKTSRDVEELEHFLTESVEAGTEGLIVKTLADTYEPSKRSSHWLKLKKDYMEGVGDTFDVVPVGAFYGKGKRTGVFGAYLLAIYDPDTETYQTISKLGTGFSEEALAKLSDDMRPHIIPQPRNYYSWSDQLAPDVWFDAAAVWEVKAADLSISPRHQAARGLVDETKGISIRFPRLLRVRDDKGPEDATTAEQVAAMFRSQAVIRQAQAAKAKDDDDEDDA